MNAEVSRRVFVGSVAVAGVGALGAASLRDSFFAPSIVAAQTVPNGEVIEEIDRQLKDALAKMQDGLGAGARQAATVLRLYASTVNDAQFRAALRKANRRALVTAQMNHGELIQRARKLGVNPARLPPHSFDRVGTEAAFDRLSKEGLAPSMREAADLVDKLADKLDDLARRQGGPQLLTVALRQPIPDPVDCGNCQTEQAQVDWAANQVTVACALAAAFPFPPLQAACGAASAALLVLLSALGICTAYVNLCRYYYGQ